MNYRRLDILHQVYTPLGKTGRDICHYSASCPHSSNDAVWKKTNEYRQPVLSL